MPDMTTTEIVILLSNMRDDLQEVRDRARRTETRLTRYLEHQGVDTKATKPRFDHQTHTVHMPSPDCSVRDAMAAVPPLIRTRVLTVNLMVGSDLIGTMTLPAL